LKCRRAGRKKIMNRETRGRKENKKGEGKQEEGK
jgi:hypothetical protein